MDDKQTDIPDNSGGSEGRGGVSRGGHRRIWTGLFLLAIGGALLLDQMGFPFPDWFFNWHMLLIIIGLFLGLRSGFHGAAWFILILVGSFYLFKDFNPLMPVDRFIWPSVMIGLGLLFILRPHRHGPWTDKDYRHWRRPKPWDDWKDNKDKPGYTGYKGPNWSQAKESGMSDDYLDSTAIFGGSHKKIVTKNFRGGDVTSIMGGTEIDFSQADINGVAVLDVTQIMGGTKIIVPPHWEVRTHVNAVFAGFEDKRQQPAVVNPDKVLILEGTSIFGGIELRNY